MDVPKKISGKWRRICKKILKQCENISASICTITADSPWSNGPIERHNEIIGPTFTKIIEEQIVNYLLLGLLMQTALRKMFMVFLLISKFLKSVSYCI